ncbi:MAG: DNA recombination protein RmuC [Bacteroidota bacterium]|nr:DNA recombination protein RmuC [Bacteroidota bacterium]
MEIIIGFVSFFVGGIIVFVVKNNEKRNLRETLNGECQRVEEERKETVNSVVTKLRIEEERRSNFERLYIEQKEYLQSERKQNNDLNIELSMIKTQNDNLHIRMVEKENEQQENQKKMTVEFENLAQKILKNNSLEFAESNQKRLNDILSPFKEGINKFEKRVVEINENRIREQSELKTHLKTLQDVNLQITEEAKNLTKALKGDVKKQGNWGELILSKVLESSGLTKGVEYDVEQSLRADGGTIFRPDAVVYLPQNKHVIIDSKVSLVAYNNMISASTNQERKIAADNHLISIKTHIDTLSGKRYQILEGLDTPDFVLLFMPIESAFSTAMQCDADLFAYAWEKKIVIVSPTTLLATLKTIASIWQQEKQTQNALEIAKQGGLVYDTLASFLKEYEKIGVQLNTVQKTYESADKKLSAGRQSLLSRIDKLKGLGAKVSKKLPDKYDLL